MCRQFVTLKYTYFGLPPHLTILAILDHSRLGCLRIILR